MILAAVKDNVQEIFKAPFTAYNENEAIRNMKVVINDKNSFMYHSSGDYDLYKIAEWDERSGQITATLEKLANGAHLKEVE